MAQNQTQTQNSPQRRHQQYWMCTICNEPSYFMPYRIYEAEVNEYGITVTYALLYAASSSEEAERWASEHCRHIVTCS